jgi:hypothetical protein
MQSYSLFSHLINLLRHLVPLFILPLGVSGGCFSTRSTIGHFGSWHFGQGVEYKADVAPGQHSISTTSTNISVCIIASLGLGAVLGLWAYDDVLLRRATRLHGSLITNIRYRHVPLSSTYLHCEL